MKKYDIDFLVVNIKSIVVLSMFIFSYIGTLPLYFGWDEYRNYIGIQDRYIIFKVFAFTSWSILSLVLGFICTKQFLRLSSNNITSLPTRSLTKKENKLIILLLFLCITVVIIYIIKVKEIALWVAITKGANAAALARSKMGNDFPGKYHWYTLMMHNVLNIITFTFFANWLIIKRWTNFTTFLLAVSCATFTSLMAIEKSRFALLLTGLFLTYLIVKKDGKIHIHSALKLFSILIILLTLSYIYFAGIQDPIRAILCVFSRLFNGQIQPAYFYLDFFPTHHDFLWGLSFPNPGGIFPFKPYNLTVEIMNWRFPNLSEEGIVGSMPTVFWGELYANFGTLGVIGVPFFVGIALYFVNFLIDKLENTSLKVGVYIWLIFHYMDLSSTGISAFVIDFYLVGILLFVFPIIFISNSQKLSRKLRHRLNILSISLSMLFMKSLRCNMTL